MASPKGDATPSLLKRTIAIPPMFTRTTMEKLAEQPLLSSSITFPTPDFTRAIASKHGTTIPQAIAHRGYKAACPENTMAAFVGAVDVGAHALETDVHLTKDNVVVLSHDSDLKRCFGRPEKIINCDWEYLSTLQTIQQPPEPMSRLVDLLRYLARPGLERIWLMLDIKVDNDADDMMRLIAEAISQVPASRPWKERIVLGCWAIKYLPLCEEHLPGFPVAFIGFSTTYARQFLKVPNISFNMLQDVLIGPFGASFARDAKALNRPIYDWTVNVERKMRWSIRKGHDGVVTDDPKKFLDLCEKWETDNSKEKFSVKDWLGVFRVHVFLAIFVLLFRIWFGWGGEKHVAQRRAFKAR